LVSALAIFAPAEGEESIIGAWAWDGGGWVLTVLPGNLAVGTLNNVAMAVYEYRLTPGRIHVTDLLPPPNADDEERECVTRNEAVYGYSIAEDRLTLSVVKEACPGRANAFTSADYARLAIPHYE
jgi:hypothetical protein